MKKVAFTVYLFYLLYAPVFYYGSSLLLSQYMLSGMLLVIVGLLNISAVKNYVIPFLKKKVVISFIFGIIVASIYYCIRHMLAGYDLSFERSRIVQNCVVLIYLLHALSVTAILRSKGCSFEDALEMIFQVASIQGVLCLLMFIFPPLKYIADHIYVNGTKAFNFGDYILLTRIFGISGDYTYGMPIVHGILTAICFYYAASKNRKYFIYFPFIFLVSILNSRTGVFVGLVGMLMVLLQKTIKSHTIKVSKKTFVIELSIIFLLIIVVRTNQNVQTFIMILFDEITTFFFKHQAVGTIRYLLDTHFFLPSGWGLLFGEGYRVFGDEAAEMRMLATDVGIVNDMFMGGLIYCGILYGTYMAFLFAKKDGSPKSIIRVIILSSLLIADIKGQVTVNYSICVFAMLIISFMIFLKEDGATGGVCIKWKKLRFLL